MRNLRKNLMVVLIVFFTFCINTAVYSHPGRTDSKGGHYVRTPGWGYPVGSYHYHNGSNASGSTSSSSSNATEYVYTDFRVTYDGVNVTDNSKDPLIAKEYPLAVQLTDTSTGARGWNWYIWINSEGWVLFSTEQNPACTIWGEGAAIKLVLNWNSNNNKIHTVNTLVKPDFSIHYGTNNLNVTDNNKRPIVINEVPLKVQLKDTSVGARSWNWYIWVDEEGWVLFSNEQNPTCTMWSGGGAIKLVINSDPDRYVIHNVNSQVSP